MENILIPELIDSRSELIQIWGDAIVEVIQRLADVAEVIWKFVQTWSNLILNSKNRKIKHLALHAKKKRTRKKNQHRIQKEYKKIFKFL